MKRFLRILLPVMMIGAVAAPFVAPGIAAAANGSGTMTVTPNWVAPGATGNQFVFTFTAGATFGSGSEATVTVPSGWAPPTASNTALNLSASTCTGLSMSTSGQVITINNMTCASSTNTFVLDYGITGGLITAPTTLNSYQFVTATRSGSGGSPVNIQSADIQPTISVVNCSSATIGSGCGTMSVSTTPTVIS